MVTRITDKNFELKKIHDIVVETIRKLYPEEKFPGNLFPDIDSLLFDLFIEVIKRQKDLREWVWDSKKKKKVKELMLDILNFQNLLKAHPQTIVLIYRKCIEKYIFYKHGRADEREDILQEVVTRLMEDKIYKIQERYNFNLKKFSTFTSYLMVTVRNIYIDIIRERNIRPLTAGELQPVDNLFNGYESENMMNRLLIEEELLKLQTIMKLYHKSRPKLELCLKLKYRIPLEREETRHCFPKCSMDDVDTLTQDFKRIKDKTMFEKVIRVFNQHEEKRSKSDTIRKWIFVKIDEIISHLNRTHHTNVYNRKNVGELISLYYQQKGSINKISVSTANYF